MVDEQEEFEHKVQIANSKLAYLRTKYAEFLDNMPQGKDPLDNAIMSVVNPTTIYEALPSEKRDRLKININIADPIDTGHLIEDVIEQLEFMPASPKARFWFEKCFVFPDETPSSPKTLNNCWLEKEKEPDKCVGCGHKSNNPDSHFPNYSKKCTDNFLECVLAGADPKKAKEKELDKKSRFIMQGVAGEGKSNYINYLLSTKQDWFWEKKLISARISLVNKSFHSVFCEVDGELPGYSEKKRDIFSSWVKFKLWRIIRRYYMTGATMIVTDQDIDLDYITKKKLENILGREIQVDKSSNHDGVNILRVEGGPIYANDKDKNDKLRKLKELPDELRKLISELVEKSGKTLKMEAIEDLKNQIKISLSGEGKGQAIISSLDSDKSGLDSTDYIIWQNNWKDYNLSFIEEVINKLQDYGFRFFIIYDGADAHHLQENSERLLREIYKELHEVLQPSPFKVSGTHMIVTRTISLEGMRIYETNFNRLIAGHTMLKMYPVGISSILKKRIDYIAGKNTNLYRGLLFPKLYQEIISLISSQLKGGDGFEDLLNFYMGNRRKALVSIKLIMGKLYTRISRTTKRVFSPFVSEDKKLLEDAVDKDLQFFMGGLGETGRTLTSLLVCRNKVIYFSFYKTDIGDCVSSNGIVKKMLLRTISDEITNRGKDKYGAPPDILNYVKNLIHGTTHRNKMYLKPRLLVACENGAPRMLSRLKNDFAEFYRISGEEVEFEIDVLHHAGLLETTDNTQSSNPSYQATKYWNNLYAKIWDDYYFVAPMFPSLNIPDNINIMFKEFTPYPLVDEARTPAEGDELFKKAHADVKILEVMMLEYLRKTYELDMKLEERSTQWPKLFNGIVGVKSDKLRKPKFLDFLVTAAGITQIETLDHLINMVDAKIAVIGKN